MAEQTSPWARPDTPVEVPAGASAYPQPPASGPPRPGLAQPGRPAVPPLTRTGTGSPASSRPPVTPPLTSRPSTTAPLTSRPSTTAPLTSPAQAGRPAASYPRDAGTARAGAVTMTRDRPMPEPPQFGPGEDPVARNKMLMRWFGGAAGLVVIIGLIATLVMVLSGSAGGTPSIFDDRADAPPDTRPELAKNCPVPSAYPEPEPAPPAPPGPRTVDEESGVSYQAYSAPWEAWPMTWTGGTLRVQYKVGQHFVTERYAGGSYHASILSASVPATVNDALAVDLKCTGRQVAADVRQEYYPNPNRLEQLAERETRLGGRPAWVSKFRLHFSRPGLTAKSELVGLALIDVGRPEVAIVYISIPETHRQYDPLVDEVLESVRPV